MQPNSTFDLQLLETFWITETNTEHDLCAHGKVRVTVLWFYYFFISRML